MNATHSLAVALLTATYAAMSAADTLGAEGAAPAAVVTVGPVDLKRTVRSPFDGSEQPYRLYLPSAHDGQQPVPLLVALHGTGGDENKYFDHATYHNGIYQREAERRGLAVLCPFGGDAIGKPTEWRGVGELHVLAAIDDVCRRFRIDEDRIVLTGQSMGGTGTTYLCCRYPDRFAAGIPLASTYGHVSLMTNLRHVPMFYVHGGKDWPVYAKTGPIPLVAEMKRLGYDGTLWMIADSEHNTMDVSTERVLDWALEQRLVRHPRHVTHRAYFPWHGRAYWVEIGNIDRIGGFAEIDARIEADNCVAVTLTNTLQATLRPEPKLLDLDSPLTVTIGGEPAFTGVCRADQEIHFQRSEQRWRGEVRPRRAHSLADYRQHLIGTCVTPPTWDGTAETSHGSWEADAMRDAAGTDLALVTKGHHRGIPIRAGQQVNIVDFINWLRPGDSALVRCRLNGSDVLEILEENLQDGAREQRFLVQVSGCRYRFDRRKPLGSRVAWSDLDPEREYSVVCRSQDLARTDTMHLGDRYDKILVETLDLNSLSAAWRYIEKSGGKIEAQLDGRVAEVKDSE